MENPPDHMRAREIESGTRLQSKLNKELRPLDKQPDGDFVDIDGTVYDVMGMPEAFGEHWAGGVGFKRSIDKHLEKSVDRIVIDLTGSTPAQRQVIKDYVDSLDHRNVGNIEYIGE